MDRDFVSRRAGRSVPTSSITVALLEANLPVAYGVVRDISEIGVCVVTDTALSPGRSFELRMSFFGSEVLEAVVRVVWREAEGGGASSKGVPHGLEFTEIQSGQLETLKRILGAGGFGSKNGH